MPFTSLGLSRYFSPVLKDLGYSTPTPIQNRVIPAALNQQDVLGIAKTGSGKTAGFVLPILHQLLLNPCSQHREPSVLVLIPTRELADQVHQVFLDFLPALKDSPYRPHCQAIYGGVSINLQMKALSRVDILVATPGRLLDLVNKNAVRLSSVSTLVLDEADKMLNLGFKEEVDHILSLLPKRRQNLLFSATLSEDIQPIQNAMLHNPKIVNLTSGAESLEDVELIHQLAYLVEDEKKGPLLRYLIKKENRKQVLVFASSIHRVDAIVNKLRKNNIDADAIHSKQSQQSRRMVLQDFKSGSLRVLVATDLLSRGIDIEFLPCVINYELPRSPKDYIHRIGRTGRAESPGDALSLVSSDESRHFQVIQKKMGKRVTMLPSNEIDLRGY